MIITRAATAHERDNELKIPISELPLVSKFSLLTNLDKEEEEEVNYFQMSESPTIKTDLGLEALKPLMREGEVFMTNASKESELMVSRIDGDGQIKFEKEESGSQLADRLASYGGWESIRVVNSAFDTSGKKIDGMVALVGVKKKGSSQA